MKKKYLSFYCIIFSLICQFLLCLSGESAFAGTQDFYFSAFNADYYISKNVDGTADMRVVESLVAEFPDRKQNKGICREIPFTNQGGKNRTIDELTRRDITVTRNGISEPIYSIETEGNVYTVCTGTEEYVLGTQIYTFEYNFKRVAMADPTVAGGKQEIYWDTNGVGWKQRFDVLKATVHFEDPDMMTGNYSCYVGKSGEKGSNRCVVEKTADGFTFMTTSLAIRENLTFDIELEANSFVIPDPVQNNFMRGLAIIVVAVSAFLLVKPIKKFRATKEKRQFHKEYFVKPEYAAPKDYVLEEMAVAYIGKTKDVKTAMLLHLIVEKKIQLIKTEEKALIGKKEGWKIKILNLDDITSSENTLLRIIGNGNNPQVGDEIKVEAHAATSSLVALGKQLDHAGIMEARRDGLVDENFKFKSAIMTSFKEVLTIIFTVYALIFLFIGFAALEEGELSSDGVLYSNGEEIVDFIPMLILIFVTAGLCIIIKSRLKKATNDYLNRTMKGLEMSRYMDGLKMYITMAEKDRIEFFQSVKNADVSDEGIVKLNEKLLPYAALFGVEKSWMAELSDYYKTHNIDCPDWYAINNFAAFSEVSSAIHSATTYVNTSSHYTSSGGGGGGGGGFSGGGGGGGGGGGR